MLIFVEGERPENPEKKPLEQGRTRTGNNLNKLMTPGPAFKLGIDIAKIWNKKV